MLANVYHSKGQFLLMEKPKPVICEDEDAIVRVTMSSICTSDLHIKHGSVPRAVPGVTVGHEMVGIVEAVGSAVNRVNVGDRVVVNVETFCGHCFFCRRGFVNNCTNPTGGWALGCRIDGAQAEYVRVPLANQGLSRIPDNVSDTQALFVGDILATGDWAARISEIQKEDTILIVGGGPTGICTLACAKLYPHRRIILTEIDPERRTFIQRHYPEVVVIAPEELEKTLQQYTEYGGADVVIECAGGPSTFETAWKAARPNAIVTIVALYDQPQVLPLPQMYGKNLIFKTGGVDGCHCDDILQNIAQGHIDTTPLITHTYSLANIEAAYDLFENRHEFVMKVAIV